MEILLIEDNIDISLPEGNGFIVLERLKQLGKQDGVISTKVSLEFLPTFIKFLRLFNTHIIKWMR